jgi:hypothetical protein
LAHPRAGVRGPRAAPDQSPVSVQLTTWGV